MTELERNGYGNVAGLKRRFAIEVEDYDDKEGLIHELSPSPVWPDPSSLPLMRTLWFSSSRLWAGARCSPRARPRGRLRQGYGGASGKGSRSCRSRWDLPPEEENEGRRHGGRPQEVHGGQFVVKAGARCLPVTEEDRTPEPRKTAEVVDGVLQADVVCDAPSTAAWVVLGSSSNGWKVWKDQRGRSINTYRR